jgi:GNAT superfamily N-acetyltransferase
LTASIETPLRVDELTRIASHQAITLFIARSQGVGTALTRAALDMAQQQGARSIDLTSRTARVAANRLYQQLGFQLRDSNVYRYQPQPPAP